MNISYDKAVTMISEQTGKSESEIETKIQEKLNQLTGLISKEGAAHIIANELGAKIVDENTKQKIGDIKPGTGNVEVTGKVTAVYEIREFKNEQRSGKVGSCMIADETGTIRIVMWNDKADNLKKIEQGNVIKLTNGFAKQNQRNPDFKEIHLNDSSTIEINPEGEDIQVKTSSQSRKHINELQENEENVELLGHIVQLFDPKFYEICPECGKRTKPQDGEFNCPQHGSIDPAYAYLLNFVLDDGTETIRSVCFRNQAATLLDKSEEEIQQFRTEPEKFTQIKNDLLGELIKVRGKTQKNQMFDRLEFVAFSVDRNPDPDQELKDES
ncbi:MAG: OB-fold nucleic acid binding domain-containing protein [Candidatus Woesearchaeota archaeon]